jgi:septum site-determining protein MinC
MQDVISIKGHKDSLRVIIDEAAEWPAVVVALREQLEQSGSFFAGARLIIEVGDRQIEEQQLGEALAIMEHYGLRPDALAATTREGRNAARAAGLITRPMSSPKPPSEPSPEGGALLVCRTLHSGQVVRHQGPITLIGDVNPGAQVIAGGSVVIWGRLRGLVHAGVFGDEMALVCALDLRPTQLRIASLIARTPDGTASSVPEIARIEQDCIVVESWDMFKRGPGKTER